MDLFFRLILGHFLADFTFQTNKLAGWKRESTWGMIVHSVTHPLVSLVVALPYLMEVWYRVGNWNVQGWFCIVAICFCHWAQDEFRVWLIQKRHWRDSTELFLVDQALHIGTLYLLVPPQFTEGFTTPTWVWITMAVVLLTHFLSVLIFFLERDLDGESSILSRHKYSYMLERVVGVGLFLVPGVGMLFGLVWIGWIWMTTLGKRLPRTWIHLFVANLAVVLTGVGLRAFLS